MTFVIGGTEAAGATTARLLREGAPSVDLDLEPAAAVVGEVGFFATSIEDGARIRQIDVFNDAGTLLDMVVLR